MEPAGQYAPHCIEVWPPQPAKSDGDHASVKPMIRLLEPRIRHVKVMVLKHQSTLRPDKILKPHATLRKKLRVPGDFRRILVDRCVNRTRAGIEKRNYTADRREPETQHQGCSKQTSARMSGTAQHLLADQFKALQRKPRMWRVPGDDSHLGCGKKKVDV